MRRAFLLIAIGFGLLIMSQNSSGASKSSGVDCGSQNGVYYCCDQFGHCYPAPKPKPAEQ